MASLLFYIRLKMMSENWGNIPPGGLPRNVIYFIFKGLLTVCVRVCEGESERESERERERERDCVIVEFGNK